MVILQCKVCEEVIRLTENALASIICQKCGRISFAFDGECEFESKDGEIINTDGKFDSMFPHLYKVRRVLSKVVEEEPIIKKFEPKEEVKEEIELPKEKPIKKPKRVRAPRIRKPKKK